MTVLTTSRPGVVEIVTDIAKADEGTALLVVELLAYDALCNEVDRIQPQLDRDAARLMAKRAEGALEHVAKRYSVCKSDYERAELEELAGSLLQIVTVSKETDDNPQTPWWDARDDSGRFVARGLRGSLMRSLAGTKATDQHRATVGALNLFGPEDAATKEALHQGFQNIKDSNRYSTARALGRGLEQVQQPHARAVGSIVRMVGDIGPEAEKVFGTGLTRLAYRYRGTERRPNPQYNDVIQDQLNPPGGKKLTDQQRLDVVADQGARFLWKSVPDQKLAELSLASGKLPPSRGIIFDAEGHPVSESVGFNGDHYLPFDLKNLKRLRGGQYVRTRTTGGLTDEDIYTGLLTGARQVTVISNSGVFTIEFDPSLRGGRRYSDKARQMVGRYSQLLATIQPGTMVRQDLSPEEIAQIRQKAFDKAKGNAVLAEQYRKDEENKLRFERKFTSVPDEVLQDRAEKMARAQLRGQQARGEVKGVSERTLAQRQRDIFDELRREERKKAVTYYKLDGEGYEAAQDALTQEFPYFIRNKRYEPLPSFLNRGNLLQPHEPLPPRPGKDIGYASRGSLHQGKRPPAAEPTTDEQTTTAPAAQRGFGESVRAENPTATEAAAWHEALSDPGREDDLASALDKSLVYRRRYRGRPGEEDLELPPEHVAGDDDGKRLGAEAYGLWVLDDKGDARGVAKFLLDPKTNEEHINKTIDAIKVVKPLIRPTEEAYSAVEADRAIRLLEQAKLLRNPWADAAENPVYASPTRPQPFDDITKLVGNRQALAAYAEANQDLAEKAQVYLATDGEQKAKSGIEQDLREVRLIRRWPKEPNGQVDPEAPPSGVKATDAEANLFLADPQSTELYQRLELNQKAWALAQAARLNAAISGTGVPELGPKVEKAHRAPNGSRLVARPQSRVRKSQSASQPGSSPSFLEAVIAERVKDDPAFLAQLLSSQR